MKEKNFTYTTALEKKAEDLLSAAKDERYTNDLQNQMTKLQSSIKQNRSTDLHRFKTDISELLTAEIAFHYKLTSGQIELSMDQDEEILEAKKILENTSQYKKILSPL
jgi:carboxyl-terminal processing protease